MVRVSLGGSPVSSTPVDQLLDFDEAVEYLHVTERRLRRAVAERRIEHIRCGRLLRFRRGSLETYLAAQTRRPVELRTRRTRSDG